MSDVIQLQMAARGVLTLPKALRQSYGLKPGDMFTLLDLGGVFVLSPRRSEVDALAERISQTLTAQGESLQSMLTALREERERYGEEP
jgi:bifunctional DNA-binding transcriptional regulator/antitoxin component of YhaV-PrlF toxin-antitoxin module